MPQFEYFELFDRFCTLRMLFSVHRHGKLWRVDSIISVQGN